MATVTLKYGRLGKLGGSSYRPLQSGAPSVPREEAVSILRRMGYLVVTRPNDAPMVFLKPNDPHLPTRIDV
jgi:hypothetical protein